MFLTAYCDHAPAEASTLGSSCIALTIFTCA
jgi:hypothetical protein